jgi:chromosome segregation ATPase
MMDVQEREWIQRVPSTASEGRNGSPMKQRRQMADNMKELQAQGDTQLDWSFEDDDDLEDALFRRVYGEEETNTIAAKNAEKIHEKVTALEAEKKRLEEKCRALQATVDTTRKENAMLKMKTTIAMGSMKLRIDSLEEDKQYRIEKCQNFEGKVVELRMENASKQNRINKLEVEASRTNQNEIRMRDAHHLGMKVKGTRPISYSDPYSFSSTVLT